MSEKPIFDPTRESHIDPLRELARKERRVLLLVSTIGIAMERIGLFPERIKALGIEFSATHIKFMPMFLAAIVAYFFITFLLYALTDLLEFKTKRVGRNMEAILSDMEMIEKLPGGKPSRVFSEGEKGEKFEIATPKEHAKITEELENLATKAASVTKEIGKLLDGTDLQARLGYS